MQPRPRTPSVGPRRRRSAAPHQPAAQAPYRVARNSPTVQLAQVPAQAQPRRLATTLGPTSRLPEMRGQASRRRLTYHLLFWSGLLASLGLWWTNTTVGSVDSVGVALTEGGRITGMIGGYALLVQVLLMSRVGWLDRRISANDLTLLHRDLGHIVVVTVLAHVALLIVGYATFDGVSWLAETTTLITTYEDMISAFVATGVLVGVGLLAVRAVRAVMPYELWHYLHMTSYLVLLFGYGHQFAVGRELHHAGIGRTLWTGLYLFVIACLVWGRLIAPLRLNARHRLRVADVVEEGESMVSIYVRGDRLDALQARAGQFFRWRFLAPGVWTQAHPFSLSAAPNGHWLRLTVKVVGDHTEQLRWLEPGTRVIVEGPSGVFTADRRLRHRALLIAGGSGIAPIRALLEDLPRGTIVLYRASSPDDLIFRDELDWLAETRDSEVLYVIGARDDPGPREIMTPKGLRHLVPDISRRDVYLCGPPGLVSASVEILRRLRVPKKQIHLDPFEF